MQFFSIGRNIYYIYNRRDGHLKELASSSVLGTRPIAGDREFHSARHRVDGPVDGGQGKFVQRSSTTLPELDSVFGDDALRDGLPFERSFHQVKYIFDGVEVWRAWRNLKQHSTDTCKCPLCHFGCLPGAIVLQNPSASSRCDTLKCCRKVRLNQVGHFLAAHGAAEMATKHNTPLA